MKKISSILSAMIFLQILNSHLAAQTASITCPSNKIVSTSPTTCDAIVNNIDPTFSPSNALVNYSIDGIGGTVIGVGSASGKTFFRGVNLVTYKLYDYSGVSCSFTVTVEDHTPPVIICPQNITVACAQDIPLPGGVTATDGCTQSSAIDVKFVGEVQSNFQCINRYVLTRTYKATDEFGNFSTCSQTVTVNDTVPPHFMQPPPISPLYVSCSANVPPVFPDGYTAYDECTPIDEIDDILVRFKQVKSDSTCPNKYTLTRTWTAADACGNQVVYKQIIYVNDKEAPSFSNPPSSTPVTVSCASDIPAAPTVNAVDNCTGDAATVTFKEVKSDEQCVNKFKLTRTWTTADACGNTSSCTQTIIVNDNQAPVFDGVPPTSSILVSCEKDIPAAPSQTATDNCNGKPTISFTEVKSNIQCANRFTLTRTWIATDECGNTSSRTQTINVNDTKGPSISSISADPIVLWPPNHKMRDVTINYTVLDNCEAASTLSISSSEPVNGGSDGDKAPDWEVIDAHHVRLRAEKSNNGQARYYTITIHVTDGCNPPVDSTVTVVVAHNITSPQTGNSYKIGSTVSLNGSFWDKPGNTHSAKWLLDGSAITNGAVAEPSGNQNGKVSGNYKFNTAGVYKLQMNVTDQTGVTSWANTNNDLDAIVVIYDPNGGNAYGGGWYESPAGALTASPSATGKASYGFAVNYANAAKPKGETQFEFKVGSFEFNALNFDYLSINGAKAQFKGTGKIIGGQSGIGFIMTVKDGDLDSTGIDKIRMKIYNRNTGYVYYDNQPGASDADDPATFVGANSSIIIQGSQSVNTTTNEATIKEEAVNENVDNKLQLVVYPNPTGNHFTVQAKTNDVATKLLLQIFDQQGRLIEKKDNLPAGSVIQLGETYRPGIYYVRIQQGSQHSEMKLVKLSN